MNRRLLVSGTCLALLAGAGPALAAPSDPGSPTQRIDPGQPVVTGRVVIGDGHLDVGPRLRGGNWQVAVHDDRTRTPVWRRPSDVVIRVHDAAVLTAPRSAPYAFLGGARGSRVYVIPQTQNRAVVWTGWNTQDPAVRDAVTLGATFTFRGARGPGALHVFLQSGTGGAPQLLWSSARRGPQPLFVEANTHTHANWVFTRPGTYSVDLEIAATLRSGRRVSDRQTLRFAVGDATPASFAVAPTPAATSRGAATASDAGSVEPSAVADESGPPSGSATWLLTGGVVVALVVGGAVVSVQGRSRRRRAAAAIVDRGSG